VLQAATTAFASHPYGEVSVAAIAAAAGFTKGAVYSNFGGKPQLFAAVLAEQFTGYLGSAVTDAVAAIDAGGSAGAARAVARSLTSALVRDQRLPALLAEFRALAVRDPELAPVYAELRLRQRLELQQLLVEVADRLPIAPPLAPEVAATLLLTCVNSLSLEYAAAPTSVPEPLIESMLTYVVSGILA
jgi:AcrR family transcriptional regulator